jgi:serine/threonine-protein kinase HipA
MDIALSDIERLASETVTRSITVPGVQPKLSMHIESQSGASRFTIVGLWGGFVLKPPVPEYPGLPENEDIVMTLADLAGIETVPHGLIRFASGELGYITRRIDRQNTLKIHMEDFCQLSGRLTHEKYNGSLESASKVISRYTTNAGYDMIRLFSSALFSFLTGNADMHLKNYSLIKLQDGTTTLSPAYDLVSTALAMPQDREESALTINGKKNRLERIDFLSLASYMGIPTKSAENEIHRFAKWKTNITGIIESSFLMQEAKQHLLSLIDERSERLGI